MSKVWSLELRKVELIDGELVIENPPIDEYEQRLHAANLFVRKGGSDINSVGSCWLRAHKMRNGNLEEKKTKK